MILISHTQPNCLINSLRPSDASMRHQPRRSLVQIRACHHYLNQCWKIVNWTIGKKTCIWYDVRKMSAILSQPQCVDIEHQCTITKHAYCNSIITTYCTLKFIWPRPWVGDWLTDTYRLVPKLLADVHAWESLHICLALPGCGRSFYPNLGELCSEKGCHDTCPVFYI